MEDEQEEKRMDQMVGNVLIIGGIILLIVGIGSIIIGFGHVGIAAGSIAAGIQSAIGNVAAGSAFAKFTSLGMLGVFNALSISGAISLLGGLVIKFWRNIYSGWRRFQRRTVTWWESFADNCRNWFRMVGRRFDRFGRNCRNFFIYLWRRITR